MRDLISASVAAITRYSPASSSCSSCMSSMYCMYWRVISASGMSRMSRFCRRMRYSSRSSGPSKASRNTSSACGGMYRSRGSCEIGSPLTTANGISACSGALAGGAGGAGAFETRSSGRAAVSLLPQSARRCIARRTSSSVSRAAARALSRRPRPRYRAPARDCPRTPARAAACRRSPRRSCRSAAACSPGSRCRRCGSRRSPRLRCRSSEYILCRSHTGHLSGSPGSVRRTRAGSVCMACSFFTTASGLFAQPDRVAVGLRHLAPVEARAPSAWRSAAPAGSGRMVMPVPSRNPSSRSRSATVMRLLLCTSACARCERLGVAALLELAAQLAVDGGVAPAQALDGALGLGLEFRLAAVEVVEAPRDLARDLHVRHLVLADRHVMRPGTPGCRRTAAADSRESRRWRDPSP